MIPHCWTVTWSIKNLVVEFVVKDFVEFVVKD